MDVGPSRKRNRPIERPAWCANSRPPLPPQSGSSSNTSRGQRSTDSGGSLSRRKAGPLWGVIVVAGACWPIDAQPRPRVARLALIAQRRHHGGPARGAASFRNPWAQSSRYGRAASPESARSSSRCPTSGPSPRVRGSPVVAAWLMPSGVHPRVCGGACRTPMFRRCRTGPSPRVRGSRDRTGECCTELLQGPSPRVRGSRQKACSGSKDRVHPRVCGGA